MPDSSHTPLTLHRADLHPTPNVMTGEGFDARSRLGTRLLDWKKRAGVAFWRFADKRIPKEWLFLVLGGLALLAYVFVLFFGTRPRK